MFDSLFEFLRTVWSAYFEFIVSVLKLVFKFVTNLDKVVKWAAACAIIMMTMMENVATWFLDGVISFADRMLAFTPPAMVDPGSLHAFYGFANTFFPLSETLACVTVLMGLTVVSAVIRLMKAVLSFFPTISN